MSIDAKHMMDTYEADLARLRQQVADLTEAVRVLGHECYRHRDNRAARMVVGMSIEMMAVNANPTAAAAVRVEQETMCSLCDHPMSEHGKHGCGVLMDSAWTASNAKPCGCRGADKRKDHQ